MSKVAKILIITRHAHRDVTEPSLDNGLSGKGEKQAIALADFYRRRYGKAAALLLSSPKLRCQQTIIPLAEKLGAAITIDQRLAERGAHESEADFEARVGVFLGWWQEQGPELTLICSHGDWIPTALRLQFGLDAGLKKSGWMEWQLEDYAVTLQWMVQSPGV